jgi:hypothetical protein
VVVGALVTVVMRLGLAHARLVVVQDIANTFSTTLVLREAPNFTRSAFITSTILVHWRDGRLPWLETLALAVL